MSRTKYDGYATYSKYNTSTTNADSDNTARFSNMPPPGPSDPSPPSNEKPTSSSLPQPFHAHTDQSRVNHIEPEKLYELLVSPQYHYVQNAQNSQNVKQPLLILIKVYTDWCKPCKIIAPEIKKLSLDPRYSNILFVEVDGEKLTQHERLASILRCSSVPTFFTFSGGKQTGFMTGIKLDEIVNLCNGLL
uniref:Thioredoxin domain-containing protein n=1 Tax=viral metagenome TaxID=1070528 RepID=A0A6C0KEY5_9ZZZZ